MKNTLYIFSGLGADERVFQHLDFSDYDARFVKWIPALPDETIGEYAARLIPRIHDKQPMLIGLSFGGIVCVEIARQIKTAKVIIIASAKETKEIPFYYRYAAKLNLHKLLLTGALLKPNKITDYFFGAVTPFEKQLLRTILADTDTAFLKWAIDKILKWKNKDYPPGLCHIHGTNDRILPLRFVKADYKIKAGGHLMTLSNPDEIMDIIKKELQHIS